MQTIKCISDTENELRIVTQRIEILEDEKMALRSKYLGVKSPNLENPLNTTSFGDNSKVVAYLHAVEIRKQPNGMSIEEELKKLHERSDYLFQRLVNMKFYLKNLTGIEYGIYSKIVVDGMNITKAVELTCDEKGISLMTGWRKYNKIKKIIEGD
jgi:hypothetical protein